MSDFVLDIHDPVVRDMALKAERIVIQVKKTCSDLHLKFEGADTFKLTDAFDDEKMMKITGAHGFIGYDWQKTSIQSEDYTFEFLKSNRQLLRYQNSKSGRSRGAFLVFFENYFWRTWNNAEAIKMATPFLKIFTDPLRVKLGEPSANYDKNVGGGQWCVTWPRIDSQKHPFDQDNVAIWLPEGGSPSDVEVELNTPFVEKEGKIIGKEDALRAALAWKGIKGEWHQASPTDKLIENKLRGGDLEIVLPQNNADVALGPVEGASGQLAWVFWFEPIHTEKYKLGWDDSFAVFVDAYTSQVIGSDGLM